VVIRCSSSSYDQRWQ